MILTGKEALQRFAPDHRLWQGIPSLEVTAKGRIWSTFYSGTTKEGFGNYCVLKHSDDEGKTWSDLTAVAYYGAQARAFDPCLWIDPLGRLWWTFNLMPQAQTVAVIFDDPDSQTPIFLEPIEIGYEVMMNKPTVLSTGEWLFPITVWDKQFAIASLSSRKDRKAFVFSTVNNGSSFRKLGGVAAEGRHFDEHMVVENTDGSLSMYIRTHYGIARAESYDGGLTWTEAVDSGIKGPDSRFFIRRLQSGRLLLVNHKNFKGRNNLTAMISEDDGKTWSEGLLLDSRDGVSYPDGKQAADGSIYITYDRDRGAFLNSLAKNQKCAREILVAKFTEEDILSGKLVSAGSYLQRIVDKLGTFVPFDGEEDPYAAYSDRKRAAYVRSLVALESEDILSRIFREYRSCYFVFDDESNDMMDACCQVLEDKTKDECDRIVAIEKIIGLFRDDKTDAWGTVVDGIVSKVRAYVGEHLTEELDLSALAKNLNISKFYLWHAFKEATGLTPTQYVARRRLAVAKQLLVDTDKSLLAIALTVGFSDVGYFAKWFKKQEGVTPFAYRKYNKIAKRYATKRK